MAEDNTFFNDFVRALPDELAPATEYVPAVKENGTEVRIRVDRLPGGGGGGGVPGVSDHGALTGLADDDHPHYHTDARGDARYYTQSAADAAFAPAAHVADTGNPHAVTAAQAGAYTTSEVDAALASKADTGHDHEGGGGAQIAHTSLSAIGVNTHAQIDAHMASTANPHAVTKAQVGLANVPDLKHNLSAITDPDVTDDSGDGYSVYSAWVNTTTGEVFVATDVTVGTAIWKNITAAASAVTSFRSRVGAVEPESGDYSGTVQDQIIRSEFLVSSMSGALGSFSFMSGGLPRTTKRWILTGNLTGSLNAPTGIPALSEGQSMDLEFTVQQNATGGWTVSSTIFSNAAYIILGATPVFDTAPNAITRIVMTAFHNGTGVVFYVYGEQFVASDANNSLVKSPKFWVGTTAQLPETRDANTIYMTTD